jgi:large subunit ribosomal protein L13
MSFSAASRSSPFAGLAKVDLTGARFRLIDARGQVLGRLASHVANLLQGKDRPTFDPSSRAGGDVCVVINAQEACLTGKKWQSKVYRHHTGAPGGLKEQTADEVWRRDPARLVWRAVAGMLPRSGAGRRDRLRKLRVFAGAEHPFSQGGGGGGNDSTGARSSSSPSLALELVPSPPPERRLRDKGLGWQLPEGFEPMNPAAYARRMRGTRGRGAVPAAVAVEGGGGGAGGEQQQKGAPPPAFDDLLAADEAAFVAQSSSTSALNKKQ